MEQEAALEWEMDLDEVIDQAERRLADEKSQAKKRALQLAREQGYHRLALAIDRLNEAPAGSQQKKTITEGAMEELFQAARPPKSFDQASVDRFVQKLDSLAAGKE